MNFFKLIFREMVNYSNVVVNASTISASHKMRNSRQLDSQLFCQEQVIYYYRTLKMHEATMHVGARRNSYKKGILYSCKIFHHPHLVKIMSQGQRTVLMVEE